MRRNRSNAAVVVHLEPLMLNKAKISRPRPKPGLLGQIRGEDNFCGQGQAEAKDKVMNKKYQLMFDSIHVNLCHYDQNDTD